MELSYKGHINGVVTAAWMAGRPVAEIYMNGEKLYPLEGDVATQILVDIAFGDIDGPLNYWLHALDWHDGGEKTVVGYEEEVLLFSGTKKEAQEKQKEYEAKQYKTRLV